MNEVDIRVPSAVPKDAQTGVTCAETPRQDAPQEDVPICPRCGKPITDADESEEYDGKLYHTGCLEAFTVTCDDCGERFPLGMLNCVHGRRVDRFVCDDCRDENYTQCHDCGEWYRSEDMYEIGGKYFCKDCNYEWFTCDDCGEAICSRREEHYTTSNGRTICESCYETSYGTCNHCGEVFRYDALHAGDDGEYYCDDCWDGGYGQSEEEEDADGVYGYHGYHGGYYPKCAKGEETDRRTRYYGVELECDKGAFDISDFYEWTNARNDIHFEHDGSLSSEGVECITQPRTLKYHQNEMDWRNLLDTLARQGFKSHNTTTCGLHIHVTRSALHATTIVKLDAFVNRASAFFWQIARRNHIYNGCYDPHKRMDLSKMSYYSGGRYEPVNTTNSRTVEIRIFRGTLKEETLLGSIEMTDALIRFLDELDVKYIYNTDENVLKFVDFCGAHADEYPHVIPMMARLVKEGIAVANIRGWAAKLNVSGNGNTMANENTTTDESEVRQCA